MDRRNWEIRNADIALYETVRQLESQRLELYQANQRADQAQRAKKSWLFGEPHIKNKIFQDDRAKDCQAIEELRSICCEEADRARQLKIDERSMQQRERESFHRESAFGSDSGIARQGEFLK